MILNAENLRRIFWKFIRMKGLPSAPQSQSLRRIKSGWWPLDSASMDRIQNLRISERYFFESFAQVQPMFTMSNNMQHDATWCNMMLLVCLKNTTGVGCFFHWLEHHWRGAVHWLIHSSKHLWNLRPGRWVQGNAQSRRWSHSHWTVHHWDSWRLKKPWELTVQPCSTCAHFFLVQRYLLRPLGNPKPKTLGYPIVPGTVC